MLNPHDYLTHTHFYNSMSKTKTTMKAETINSLKDTFPLRSEMCFKLKGSISFFSTHDLATLSVHILQLVLESDNLHQSGFNARIINTSFYHLCKTNQFLPSTSRNNKAFQFSREMLFGEAGREGMKKYFIVRNPFFQLSLPNKIPSG